MLEQMAWNLPESQAEELRHEVCCVLLKSKPPVNNLPIAEHIAVKQLTVDMDLVMVVAVKGKATVIMDRSSYEQRIPDIFESLY